MVIRKYVKSMRTKEKGIKQICLQKNFVGNLAIKCKKIARKKLGQQQNVAMNQERKYAKQARQYANKQRRNY